MKLSEAEFARAHNRWLNSNNPADALRDVRRIEELKRELEEDLERLYDKCQ